MGGLSPSIPAAHPLENIGLVCIFRERMFVVDDLLFVGISLEWVVAMDTVMVVSEDSLDFHVVFRLFE